MNLEQTRAALARVRAEKRSGDEAIIGTLCATAGGVTGALMKRYIPMIVPGEAADTVVTIMSELVITGLALWSGNPLWMAFAYGVTGYMSGVTVEKVLP